MTPVSGVGTPFSVLGFSAVQEDLYRVLLRYPELSFDRLAELVGLSVSTLKPELDGLAAGGLVELSSDTVRATAPDQALGRLISDEAQRLSNVNEQLTSLRKMLPSLMADHLSSRAPSGEPVTVEVVAGGDVVGLVRSLSVASEGDLLWMRPGQWRLDQAREIDEWVRNLVASGRRSRAIYPARVLEEAPEVVRRRAEAGEHVRILGSVPSPVAIMGTSAALLPEHWGVHSDRRLVVRQDAMIGALTALFNALWDRAMPVPGLNGHDADDGASDRRLLLDQLAGGAKDEQIARALGLSLRTVRRRVAEILDELGVESRFQAGVEAVRRGWI